MKLNPYIPIKMLLVIASGIACVQLASCHDAVESDNPEHVFVPLPPDYRNEEMWVTYLNDSASTGADVFYIPSTWEYDWYTADGRVSHHADPSLSQHRDDMKIEIDGVAEYMADGNNFYSPFYRHITLDSWATLNEDTINRRYKERTSANASPPSHWPLNDDDIDPMIRKDERA